MPLLQYPAAARFVVNGVAGARRCARWVARRRCSPPPSTLPSFSKADVSAQARDNGRLYIRYCCFAAGILMNRRALLR